MQPETKEQAVVYAERTNSLFKVTPLSKYLAMALFIILPFLGGYVGYVYAPVKVLEVEKVIIKEVLVENESVESRFVQETEAVQCEVDSDCVVVQPDCEDCQFAAIRTSEVDQFREEKRNRCELNPPEMMCDIVFNGEVKCIDNSCQIVE